MSIRLLHAALDNVGNCIVSRIDSDARRWSEAVEAKFVDLMRYLV